jgi:hypothetical protein
MTPEDRALRATYNTCECGNPCWGAFCENCQRY